MRVDKYLKVSRLIKRRTVANDEVKPGDVLSVTFGERTLTVEVVSVDEHASKADAPAMYREI